MRLRLVRVAAWRFRSAPLGGLGLCAAVLAGVLLPGLFMGIAGDYLLREGPFGIGLFALWDRRKRKAAMAPGEGPRPDPVR